MIDVDDGPSIDEVLQKLEPLLKDVAAIAAGRAGKQVKTRVEQELESAEEHGWHLRDAAHRIWAGERDGEALTAGLDEQDAALVRRVLELIG